MAGKKSRGSRPPKADEIERELANARHYLNLCINAEIATQNAIRARDMPAVKQGKADFLRELGSFLNAARTAKNYMFGAAETAGSRAWIESRLSPPTFEFHANLAGSVFHERGIELRSTIAVEPIKGTVGETKTMIIDQLPDGTMVPIVEGKEIALQYAYHPDDLEPVLAQKLSIVTSKKRPIVELAAEYVDGLEQIYKSGVRSGRFG